MDQEALHGPVQVAFAQHVTSRPVLALADLQTDQARTEPARKSGLAKNSWPGDELIAARFLYAVAASGAGATSQSCRALARNADNACALFIIIPARIC